MDRNYWIGMLLVSGLLFAWLQLNSPSKEELERQKFVQDSIATARHIADSLAKISPTASPAAAVAAPAPTDTAAMQALAGQYGAFGAAAVGTEQFSELKNDLMKVTFSNLGGRIRSVELLKYNKITLDSAGKETKSLVKILEDAQNRFAYELPVAGAAGGVVSTDKLFFTPSVTPTGIVFTADLGGGKFLKQTYTISKDNYQLDYQLSYGGLSGVLASGTKAATLKWENNLDKIELNAEYERNYSSIYYKEADDSPSYCSCTADDSEEVEKPVKWASSTNQFFNAALIAKTAFASGKFETMMNQPEDSNLKKTVATLKVPIEASGSGNFDMTWYLGPNEFNRLRAYDISLEDVIPFGSSIMGTINRWIIRPVFNMLSGVVGNYGIIILLLTLLVKLVLYPITYRMIKSQSRMASLKPEIEKLKAKHGDDQQKVQMETMKLYQEYGVNPLGGCLPMLLQMPIWLALYRFFPAAIEFRQASFLWISDLTNFETFFKFGFSIPGVGTTIGLFAILWTVTTLMYSYYTMKDVDMSSNPAMKYMQYLMPVLFFGFFNKAAAGLSFYMFASNVINIGQTLITRNFLIDQTKLRNELETKKNAPKKKGSGWMARIQEAAAEQQRLQEEMKKKQQQQKGKK